jgi:PAS domain S-box-containing protein
MSNQNQTGGRADTEREQGAVALSESESRFRAFLDNSPTLTFIKDEQGRYVYVSQIVRRYMAKDSASQLGKTDLELWPATMARQLRENDAAVLTSGKPQELAETVLGADGEPHHFLVFKFPFRDGSGKRFLGGIAVDITERKQLEERQSLYAERLRVLSRRLVEVQEEERQRLACELHDEIGQALTSLRLILEATGEPSSEAAQARLNEARGLIEEILSRVRGLSFDLRPALLDHLGLEAALRSFLERYTARTKVQVNFKHAGLEGRLPPEVETAAFRIVQEALTNIARHAGVSEAAVRVWRDGDTLEIQIEDQGAGFDADTVLAAGRSSGLPGMRERVKLLGGQFTLEAAPGSGTHLLARLPLSD